MTTRIYEDEWLAEIAKSEAVTPQERYPASEGWLSREEMRAKYHWGGVRTNAFVDERLAAGTLEQREGIRVSIDGRCKPVAVYRPKGDGDG